MPREKSNQCPKLYRLLKLQKQNTTLSMQLDHHYNFSKYPCPAYAFTCKTNGIVCQEYSLKRKSISLQIERKNEFCCLHVWSEETPKENSLTVYRKSTHINRYWNEESHHHPSQIQSVANTSTNINISTPNDSDTKYQEMAAIQRVLQQNGYKNHITIKATPRKQKVNQNQTDLKKLSCLTSEE